MSLIPYLAGVIDGEGTISINRCKNARYPRVSIANSSLILLEKCSEIAGANFSIVTKKKYKPHHKPAYTLSWHYDAAISVARLVYPFLIVKKAQATIILKWKQVVKRNGKYSPEEKLARDELVSSIQELNK